MIPKHVFEETLLQFFAPIRPYLDDASVSEIMINGPDQIYVERKGQLELVPAKFSSREALLSALRNLSQYVGKYVDETHPILEGRFPDGSRVEALIPPVAPDGPHVAIRRFFNTSNAAPPTANSAMVDGSGTGARTLKVSPGLSLNSPA